MLKHGVHTIKNTSHDLPKIPTLGRCLGINLSGATKQQELFNTSVWGGGSVKVHLWTRQSPSTYPQTEFCPCKSPNTSR